MKKLIIAMALALCLPLSGLGFPTNETLLTINIDKTRAFRDGRIKWHGYEDQHVQFTMKTDSGPFTTTAWSWIWKASRRVTGSTSTVYIAKNVGDITLATSNVIFSVPHTSIPPNGTYNWELLLMTATTNLVRNGGQGTLQVLDSLADDADGTWVTGWNTNLTDYLTKVEAAATYTPLGGTGTFSSVTMQGDITMGANDINFGNLGDILNLDGLDLEGPTGVDYIFSSEAGPALQINESGGAGIMHPVLAATSEANPSTTVEGSTRWDTDDDAWETYQGTASYVMPLLVSKDSTILEPDLAQAKSDAVTLFRIDSNLYPGGVVIKDIVISTSSACADTITIEEWAHVGVSYVHVSDIETITLAYTFTEDDGSLADANVATDTAVRIDLDGTSPCDVEEMQIFITFWINDFN